ncbi:Uncharacterized protein DBV15_05614, partial [Temnothorax longispinosus]
KAHLRIQGALLLKIDAFITKGISILNLWLIRTNGNGASRRAAAAAAAAPRRARTLYDVLALLSRPRYSQRQDNERPRGKRSSGGIERLYGTTRRWCHGGRMQLVKALVKVYTVITRAPRHFQD